MAPVDLAALEALLEFYVEAGVDCALDEAPHDHLAPVGGRVADQPLASGTPPQPVVAFMGAGDSADGAAVHARAEARAARTLDELRAVLERFDRCALKRMAKTLVFADGSPTSRVMFVGEAPGAEEDRIGRPFVGPSGQLLDRMLAAIGLDRSRVYIANLVPWRPPGNRTPTPQEAAICKPFIERQIELCGPDILVSLGHPAAQSLFHAKENMTRTRGKWFAYDTGTRTVRGLAMLHPAYLLRQPLHKRLAWRDMKALRAALEAPHSN